MKRTLNKASEKPPVFRRNVLASVVASAVAGISGQTVAQDVVLEELVVTGYKGSLIKAQGIKRDNTAIVEALTAEDIGKLPDSSIAESLARLPGVAGERRNGRTSGLSVRGFNENYVATTLNGRELLGIGDNRGVEYDLYPSEIISSAVVYKTPEASLMSQGVGGTVDLRTMRPLESDRILAINGTLESNDQASANQDMDDSGHRLSFNYSDRFADDTIGVALAFATTESPSQEEQFAAWGYATVNDGNVRSAANPTGSVVLGNGLTPADVSGAQIWGGHDSFARSAVLERDTYSGVFQFAPSEDLMITLDMLAIDFGDTKVFRGIEEGGPEWGTGTYGINAVEDGLVTEGTVEGFYTVIRNDAERTTGDLKTFGLNLEWAVNDKWSLKFDLADSETEKEVLNIESYSGVGRAQTAGQGPASSYDWVLSNEGVLFTPSAGQPDYSDPSVIRLAGPNAWGGALFPFPQFQATATQPLGFNTAQDGFVNRPLFADDLTTVRFDLEGDIDGDVISRLRVGINYSDRSRTKDNRGEFLTAPTWPTDAPIPDGASVGVIDLSFLGTQSILGYDTLGLYDSGFFTITDANLVETTRAGDSYTIEEKLLNFYVQVDLDTELAGIPVTGNVGVQVAKADQSSSSFGSVIGNNPIGFVEVTPLSGGADYTKILPSMNLSFEVAENHFIRTAASKVLSRPRLDDLRAGSSVNFFFNDASIQETSDVNNSPWSATAGNPELQPLEANQFDIAYEYYFAGSGLLSAGVFYKDIKNWHIASQTVGDFTQFFIPGYHQDTAGNAPVLSIGNVAARADGLTGSVKGYELQANVPLEIVHESLDGLGIVASAAFNDGELEGLPNNQLNGRIPGLSEEVFQFTAYYEVGGFEARISATKRDEYLTESRGTSLALTPQLDSGATLVDAQIGYNFADAGIGGLEGLTITLQAQNLTDEESRTFNQQNNNTDARQVTRFSSYGANYLLNFNYKF